ncbi:membrane protein [Desulfoplanes formicivorans]|uniref:TVP38/TMEM64 family membrane protein n=2 Tax=Desulfoplanes formicivorans TaxID=1592317 RepID=A0A194AK87_9BACT|nr:membrane protein [Desulfoplanes formicivorans]
MKKMRIALCGLVVVILACFLIKPVRDTIEQLFFLFGMYDVAYIKGYIVSFGIWAPVISFCLMLFQSVIAPLPAFLITFANAALFGWIKGAILSWSSAMAGAALCFFLAKWLGRGFVERMTSKLALEGIDDFFKQYGQYTILIARLLPFISFDIVSYAAGLTSMSFWPFFWATGLGQLPATLIYSYAGEMLVGGTQKFVMGLLILFALSILTILLKKITSRPKTEKIQTQS